MRSCIQETLEQGRQLFDEDVPLQLTTAWPVLKIWIVECIVIEELTTSPHRGDQRLDLLDRIRLEQKRAILRIDNLVVGHALPARAAKQCAQVIQRPHLLHPKVERFVRSEEH